MYSKQKRYIAVINMHANEILSYKSYGHETADGHITIQSNELLVVRFSHFYLLPVFQASLLQLI